ncbi:MULTISPECIES: hypothetical protein [Trichocoleus]|uniref:Uncharacterized protein n=1 Tax=Trichocoleus desertorum GB2-A4 TaxID=2933944 RepID=A0ABV0J5A6_9CYAN|nr:hypothetical protein [Trichocoleus sp. FACHB-46]MBD1863794.1 hypothetical protein [Trichocoleus sp. FACHB-46]
MEPLTATVIATLVVTKAFEKTGEQIGEKVWEQGGKLLKLLRHKAPETALAIEKVAETPGLAEQQPADYGTAVLVTKVEEAAKADPEVQAAVEDVATAAKAQPFTIQNMAQLAERIGIVNQGTTNFSGNTFNFN